MSADFSQHNPKSSSWEDIFDQITGTGQTLLGAAQDIKEQFTGNAPIDQGDIGGGIGEYEVTGGGGQDNERKQGASPLIWAGIGVVALIAIYFIATSAKKGKQTNTV